MIAGFPNSDLIEHLAADEPPDYGRENDSARTADMHDYRAHHRPCAAAG